MWVYAVSSVMFDEGFSFLELLKPRSDECSAFEGMGAKICRMSLASVKCGGKGGFYLRRLLLLESGLC